MVDERKIPGSDGNNIQSSGGEEPLIVPVTWDGIEQAPAIFANNVLVQHTEHEFIITFSLIHPPITLNKSNEELRETIRSVVARAAVRVVIPAGRVPEFLQVLNANYQTYRTRFGQMDQEQRVEERNE